MDLSYMQRDIDNMNEKINALHSIVENFDGLIQEEYIQNVEAVIDEWKRCTIKRMSEMLEELDT